MATVDQLLAKDFANQDAMRHHVSQIQLAGTFAQRRPDMGPMFKCPKCHRRHRVAGPRAYCSNTDYTTTQRAWTPELGFHQAPTVARPDEGFNEGAPRMNANLFPKGFVKKLTKKHHGQNLRSKIRRVTLQFQEDEAALAVAVAEYNRAHWHLKEGPKAVDIPSWTERYVRWKWAQEVKREHRQQRISRRVNLGLAKKGSR